MAVEAENKEVKAKEMFETRVKELIAAACCSDFASIDDVDWEIHRIRIVFDDMPLLLRRGKEFEVHKTPTTAVDLLFPVVAERGQLPFRTYLVHPRNLAHPNYSGFSPIPMLCHGVMGFGVQGVDLLAHIHRVLANDPDIIQTDDSMNVAHEVVEFIRDNRDSGIFPTDRRRLYARRLGQ